MPTKVDCQQRYYVNKTQMSAKVLCQSENLIGLDHASKLGPHALKGVLDVVVPDNEIDLQIIKPGMIQMCWLMIMNKNGMQIIE